MLHTKERLNMGTSRHLTARNLAGLSDGTNEAVEQIRVRILPDGRLHDMMMPALELRGLPQAALSPRPTSAWQQRLAYVDDPTLFNNSGGGLHGSLLSFIGFPSVVRARGPRLKSGGNPHFMTHMTRFPLIAYDAFPPYRI
jgi:hypothetical protein